MSSTDAVSFLIREQFGSGHNSISGLSHLAIESPLSFLRGLTVSSFHSHESELFPSESHIVDRIWLSELSHHTTGVAPLDLVPSSTLFLSTPVTMSVTRPIAHLDVSSHTQFEQPQGHQCDPPIAMSLTGVSMTWILCPPYQ
jgi:hypothetical protein